MAMNYRKAQGRTWAILSLIAAALAAATSLLQIFRHGAVFFNSGASREYKDIFTGSKAFFDHLVKTEKGAYYLISVALITVSFALLWWGIKTEPSIKEGKTKTRIIGLMTISVSIEIIWALWEIVSVLQGGHGPFSLFVYAAPILLICLGISFFSNRTDYSWSFFSKSYFVSLAVFLWILIGANAVSVLGNVVVGLLKIVLFAGIALFIFNLLLSGADSSGKESSVQSSFDRSEQMKKEVKEAERQSQKAVEKEIYGVKYRKGDRVIAVSDYAEWGTKYCEQNDIGYVTNEGNAWNPKPEVYFPQRNRYIRIDQKYIRKV